MEKAVSNVEMTEQKELINKDEIINKLDEDIQMEYQAPEGGWGWIVTLAMIIILITVIGPAPSIGLIFGDFLEPTGQTGLLLTLFGALFSITFSISSPLANYWMQKYTMRPVAVMGAVLFSASNILLALAISIWHMMILFFIQGIGVGLLLTLSNTNFNSYFVKKRARIMSLAQVIIGMGAIGYPYFIDKMMPLYGFRGTAAIIGAISLNCIPAVLMLHPVEWHTKGKKITSAERVCKAVKKSNRRLNIDDHHQDSSGQWTSLRSLKENITYKTEPTEEISNNIENEEYRVRSWSWSVREVLTERLHVFSSSSAANVASGIGALADIKSNSKILVDNTIDNTNQYKYVSCWKKFIKIMDLSMMKDLYFLNLSFGSSIAITCDFTFVSLLPIMMFHDGYTRSESALAIIVSGTAELISRILLAIFNFFVKVQAKYLFFVAMIAMSFAKAGFVMFEDTIMAVLVMNAIIGMVRALMLVPQSLVIIEHVQIDKLASAYGCFGFIMGATSLVLSPILGNIRDWTQSNEIFQYITLGIHTACIFPWTLQFFFVDFQKWRKKRRNVNLSNPSN
ncbi:monocarboxylate transporter 9-like [Polistes fuscatus]|uniref:monocarboxylate transporter 9-like n=1 Tax=Polistes fuscatus TaxID=30207 RepID=UPI001CA88DBE|nr:monocarboxylate transporter 9-like [Polistes fuscatus]